MIFHICYNHIAGEKVYFKEINMKGMVINMNCKIGEKIRKLRQGQKMTQENLADRLGVSFQSVSRWENGITYPDIELLPSIARLFSVSVDYLLGDDDKEKIKRIKRRLRRISVPNREE